MANAGGGDTVASSSKVIFDYSLPKFFYDYTFHAINSVNTDIGFGIFKLGSLCDAKKSYPFKKARCDLESASIDPDEFFARPHYYDPKIMTLGFHDVFSKGFQLLQSIKNGYIDWKDVSSHDKKALEILENFLKRKDNYFKCLKDVFSAENLTETDVTIALAEHLLGKLSPGQSYVMDERSKVKRKCRCGCNAKGAFGKTGIGDGRGWHGYLDLIFSSHEGINIGDTAVSTMLSPINDVSPAKKAKFEDDSCSFDDKDEEEEDLDEDSPGGRISAEVKLALSPILSDDTDNQIVAQAIVFSLMQKCRHPNFDDYLIPSIAISTTHFRIVMYDAKKDILIRSEDVPIFFQNSFVIESIAILWMVLHYRIFCSGINLSDKALKQLKSGFMDHVSSCKDIYLSLKSDFVSVFEKVEHCNANSLIKTGVRVNQDFKK